MDNKVGRVDSKFTWKGVEVSSPLGKKDVKIEGDKLENIPDESFIEGVFKGIATVTLGSVYPYLASAFKAVDGYYKVSSAALEVGGDSWDAAKAGLKGATIGLLKGFAHGVLDFLVIKGLAAAGGALAGPVGAIVAAGLVGGVYNLVKDTIRK